MPHKSRWSLDIPDISLPTYLFQSPDGQLSDKAVLIDADRPEFYLSLHTYREWSKRLAAGLRQRGFKPGDRLLLYSGNSIFFPVVLMGTIMAGGIFTGANPGYVARELAYQLDDSGASILITAEGSLATALEAAEQIKFPTSNIFVMGDGRETLGGRARGRGRGKGPRGGGGIKHWTSLVASIPEGSRFTWEQFETREQTNQTCVINYSSGTTGLPKGVEISHRNYVSNCLQSAHLQTLSPDYEEKRASRRAISFLPMYHAYGQTAHGIILPQMGVPVYVMARFDLVKMLQHIQRYQITSLNLVPPIAVMLTKRAEVRDYDLSSLDSATCGAAPLSGETVEELHRLFKGKMRVSQGWGMTEMTCTATGWHPEQEPHPSKVGELHINIEGMIVDEDGKEVKDGERGEFWVRGPNIMKGYWRKPDATKETITPDGWLRTGDIAIRDENGFYTIVDRKKELIKVKGNQVAPAELEGLLLDHPAVADAAVVGVTINGEEMPRAYIVLGVGKTATGKEVAKWLSSRVSRHKRLTGGVKVVEAVPKNPSGKILRKTVREWAKADVGDREKTQSRL